MNVDWLIAALRTVPVNANLYLYGNGDALMLQAEWGPAESAIIATWKKSEQYTSFDEVS